MKNFKIFKKSVVLPVIVILFLILLHYIGILTPVESFIARGMHPVTSRFYSWGMNIKSVFDDHSTKEELKIEVKELREEVNELKAEKAQLRYIEKENEQLRKYLKFFQEKDIKKKMARVISRGEFLNSEENTERIMVNKGSKDGIKEKGAVINDQGIVVGKVAQVKPSTAEITLTTNKECELAATIQNKSRTMGITQGELGLTIKMRFIPQTEEISSGDKVVTSGLEKNIPGGLLIGEVKKVNSSSNEVWQTAIIEPLAEMNELTIVSVVTKEQ